MQDLRSARQAQGGDPHLPRPQPPRLFRDGGIALITQRLRERERKRDWDFESVRVGDVVSSRKVSSSTLSFYILVFTSKRTTVQKGN